MITNSNFKRISTSVLLAVIFLAVDFSVSMPCRSFINFGTVKTDELMGKPNIPLLISMGIFSKVMLLIFFFIIKDKLPLKNPIGKAYLFTISYLIILFIPTLIGMNAYDFAGGWDMFTKGKLRNYGTIICDSIGILAATPILGLMLRSKTNTAYRVSKKLLLSMILSGIIFVLGIYCSVEFSSVIFYINSSIYPSAKSLIFNILFYTPFFFTGLGIPLINKLINFSISKVSHRILRFTSIFMIFLWMPLQNVIVAFGVSFSIGFIFSICALIPTLFCLVICEVFNEKAPLMEYVQKSRIQ